MARIIVHNHDMIARLTADPNQGVEAGPLPRGVGLERLRFDGSQLVDIATLSELHVVRRDGDWELHAVPVPGSQPVTMSHKQKWRLVNDGGTYRLKTDAEILAEAREAKCDEIGAHRNRLIARGMSYTFPDTGRTALVQTRNLVDHRNIQGLGTKALNRKMSGDSTTLPFRDADNYLHELTPQEMIDLADAVADWVQAHYNAAWSHKDSVRGLATVAEVEGYDYSSGWPAA
jgi:hypothetical protein